MNCIVNLASVVSGTQRKQRFCNSADSKEKYSKWRIHIGYITKDSKRGVAIMIYSVNYMDLTEKINPFNFAKYLIDTGWSIYPTKRKKNKNISIKKRYRQKISSYYSIG